MHERQTSVRPTEGRRADRRAPSHAEPVDGKLHTATIPVDDVTLGGSDAQREAMSDAVRRAHAAIGGAGRAAPLQLRSEPGAQATVVDVRATAARGVGGGGTSLPHAERIQAAFGRHGVGHVRAHMGSDAQQASRAIGARAYAMGESVAFSGAPDLHTAAHEAAHVVQQRAGVSVSDGVGRAGDRYERHADAVADAVVRGADASGLLDQVAGPSVGRASSAPVQRQSAPLAPVQMFGGWAGFGALAGAAKKGSDQGDDATAGPAQAGLEQGAAAKSGAAAKGEAAASAVPEMPREFGSEGVLRTWIGEFNKSLAKRIAARGNGGEKMLEKLKAKGWADDNGLSYELLAAAAATEPTTADPAKKDATTQTNEGSPPAPVANARILAMMARSNGALFNVITPDYAGLCMQFSEKMMAEMGAKRVDGTTSEKREPDGQKSALTAAYRGKRVKDLPKTLPAGYQICVTSRPEWGFTEVGNHWFISAGDGYFLDNVMGVTNGQQMEDSLIGTTGDQWGRRVVEKGLTGLRKKMGGQFVAAHPAFAGHREAGRTKSEQTKKKKGADNPDYKDASAAETQALAAIKQFVKENRSVYAPRIWIVEPTTKSGGAGAP